MLCLIFPPNLFSDKLLTVNAIKGKLCIFGQKYWCTSVLAYHIIWPLSPSVVYLSEINDLRGHISSSLCRGLFVKLLFPLTMEYHWLLPNCEWRECVSARRRWIHLQSGPRWTRRPSIGSWLVETVTYDYYPASIPIRPRNEDWAPCAFGQLLPHSAFSKTRISHRSGCHVDY